MTDREKLKIRIIIAKSVNINPDDIRLIDCISGGTPVHYALDGFKGYNLCLSFEKVPTIREAREQIKDLYLFGAEYDFDEEMDIT